MFHNTNCLHSPDEQLTSLAGSFGYVAPEVLKRPATENSSTSGPQVFLVFLHAPPNSSCLHSDHHLNAPLRLLPFRAKNTTTLSQQNPDPKIEFQSPYWNPLSDQAISFIRRLAALDPLHRPTADEVLRDPWLATTAADTPSNLGFRPLPKTESGFEGKVA